MFKVQNRERSCSALFLFVIQHIIQHKTTKYMLHYVDLWINIDYNHNIFIDKNN